MLTMLNEENKKVAYTIDSQIENIAKTVDMIAFAFENGGRLFYIGAGTSGRLGVLDASANNIGILNKEFELTIKKCLKI